MNDQFRPDTHVLIILGEIRGDVKGISRSIMSLENKIDEVEKKSAQRTRDLEDRVSSLEAVRTKIAAFVTVLGLVGAGVGAKFPAILSFLIGE